MEAIDLEHALDEQRYRNGAGGSSASTWDQPDLSLLGTGRRPAPSFPLDLLRDGWRQWVTMKAEAASAPVDYVAVSLLSCVGAGLANVRWPVAGSGWSEPPVLWTGLVGSPSAGKSPGMDAGFGLIRHVEDLWAIGSEDDRHHFEAAKEIAEAKRDAWRAELKAATKAGGLPPELPLDAIAPEPVVRPRIRVTDATIEKLGALAAGLPRGLLLYRDELAGWFGSFDRYGGGGSDRAFAIEMYGGRSYVIDRMKNADPVSIRHLSIGVLGGVQPDKLSLVLDGPDDGLSSRLLWSWPETTPSFRLARSVLDETPALAAFKAVANLPMGTDDLGQFRPKHLRLDPAAEDLIERFGQEMAVRAHEAAGPYAGALGKARGHVLRLSCILQHLWWSWQGGAEPERIDVEAVGAAAALVDGYFLPMGQRVHGDAAIPKPERHAMALARHLRRLKVRTFNARQVRREIGGDLRDAKVMDAACELLEEAGLIRHRARGLPGPGRTAKQFDINPALVRSP